MSHCDHHDHNHMRHMNRNRLKIAFMINFSLFGAEVWGGIVSKSLALLAEAGHMFTDVFSIGLAIFASYYAQRKVTQGKKSKAEDKSALINGLLLVVTSFVILWEAYERIGQPVEILGGIMLWIAVAGLIANVLGAVALHDVKDSNLNMKGVYLHLIYDAISSVGVIITALIITYTDMLWVDTLVSVLIALSILRGSVHLIKKSYRAIKNPDEETPHVQGSGCSHHHH